MKKYHDLSLITDNAYRLAKLIEGGRYQNIFYFEFHQEVDPSKIHDCTEGLEAFSKKSELYYDTFFASRFIDETPAIIHIAVKIGDEWFIAQDCGSNFYLGYGPVGILKLREACKNQMISSFLIEDKFEDWLEENFREYQIKDKENNNKERLEFELIIKNIRYLTSDMQSRRAQHQGLTEENVRDRMLVHLNIAAERRGNAEAMNCKGKTDILIRTKDGLNEHIFELKIWKGKKSLLDAIEQLKGYLAWQNTNCGVIMFCYNKDFTLILEQVKNVLGESFGFKDRERKIENEFRFKTKSKIDNYKEINVVLTMINLKLPD